jgi:DNA invertase Pin-like site-specific DNA recombinase
MQRAAILAAAFARHDNVATWYAEKRTAKTLERPELARLRADVARGLVKRLYVFRLDRLARSGIRDTLEVVEAFRKAGCELVSCRDGFSLEGPAAELVLAVMAWAAQMERLAIAERIAAAREQVEAEGGQWGRPRRTSPEEDERIRSARQQGASIRALAQAFKVPKSTVLRVLQREQAPRAAAAPEPSRRAGRRGRGGRAAVPHRPEILPAAGAVGPPLAAPVQVPLSR